LGGKRRSERRWRGFFRPKPNFLFQNPSLFFQKPNLISRKPVFFSEKKVLFPTPNLVRGKVGLDCPKRSLVFDNPGLVYSNSGLVCRKATFTRRNLSLFCRDPAFASEKPGSVFSEISSCPAYVKDRCQRKLSTRTTLNYTNKESVSLRVMRVDSSLLSLSCSSESIHPLHDPPSLTKACRFSVAEYDYLSEATETADQLTDSAAGRADVTPPCSSAQESRLK
jgi:hypothetical protein